MKLIKTTLQKVYPEIKINATGNHPLDYIKLTFKEKGIEVITCTDSCGNDFFIPYKVIERYIK